MTTAEIMQSDTLAKQKKASFYTASMNSKAKDARARKIVPEVSLPRRPRVHIADPWETVRQSVTVCRMFIVVVLFRAAADRSE